LPIASCTPGGTSWRYQGVVKAVEPQVLDLLRLPLENRDRTVTKDELHKAIWQGRFVDLRISAPKSPRDEPSTVDGATTD
jgi:DNA-binding winged helix-turn-helix (wHTH) protein